MGRGAGGFECFRAAMSVVAVLLSFLLAAARTSSLLPAPSVSVSEGVIESFLKHSLAVKTMLESLSPKHASRYDGVSEMDDAVVEAMKVIREDDLQYQCYPSTQLIYDHSSLQVSQLPKEVASLGYLTVLGITWNDEHANQTLKQLTHLVQLARQVRQRSWCMVVMVVSSDPSFLMEFARLSHLGRLQVRSTRLLVVTELPQPVVQALLRGHWTFSMMNTMFFTRLDDNDRDSLHGAPFPVTFVITKPLFYSALEMTSGAQRWRGRELTMLEVVAKTLNFTVSLVPPSISTHKCVLAVVEGRALLCATRLMLLPHILSLVDHSFPVDKASLSFSLSKPPTRPQWMSLLDPLQPAVWGLLGVLLLVLPPFMMLVVREGAQKATLTTVGLLLGQGGLHRLPRTTSARLLLISWLVFAFIMVSSYSGSLVAFLTVRKYPPRPETMDQLAATGTTSVFSDTVKWFRNYFASSAVASFRTIGQRSTVVPTALDGMEYVSTYGFAHFYERYFMVLSVAQDYTAQDGSSHLYVAKENVLPNYAAWFYPQDSPFKVNFDTVLATLIEAGLKDRWMTEEMADIMQYIRRTNKNKQKQKGPAGRKDTTGPTMRDQRDTFTLTHLQGAFWILSLGLLMALATFLMGEGGGRVVVEALRPQGTRPGTP